MGQTYFVPLSLPSHQAPCTSLAVGCNGAACTLSEISANDRRGLHVALSFEGKDFAIGLQWRVVLARACCFVARTHGHVPCNCTPRSCPIQAPQMCCAALPWLGRISVVFMHLNTGDAFVLAISHMLSGRSPLFCCFRHFLLACCRSHRVSGVSPRCTTPLPELFTLAGLMQFVRQPQACCGIGSATTRHSVCFLFSGPVVALDVCQRLRTYLPDCLALGKLSGVFQGTKWAACFNR